MSLQDYQSLQTLHNAMPEEEFNHVVEAILNGKYSWACVLILESAGYNPLHYIPYRTYNRLVKDNCTQRGHRKQSQKQSSRSLKHKISDLNHLETVSKQDIGVRGGFSHQDSPYLNNWMSSWAASS
ncbi:MAG: HetP family heterocyst commitment protein [Cyanobacteria bacterium P01_A01_bin.114]